MHLDATQAHPHRTKVPLFCLSRSGSLASAHGYDRAACYGHYILPTYLSDLATIPFDRSGTTQIGKYVISHSFIFPGPIA
jgi:anaerobic C4-dicarboxylate transporter